MAPIVFRPMQRAVTRIGALRWWVGLVLFLFTAEVRIQAAQPQTQAASVWTGTMQSESTDNVPGIRNCTELWNMNLSLTVAPDGTVAGRGTGEFIGLRGVCNRPDEAQHYTYLAFDVRGRMDGKQFTLQMIWRDVKGSMSPGLLNHTLFFGPLDGPFDPPILRVPIIASDRAEGTSTVKLKTSCIRWARAHRCHWRSVSAVRAAGFLCGDCREKGRVELMSGRCSGYFVTKSNAGLALLVLLARLLAQTQLH